MKEKAFIHLLSFVLCGCIFLSFGLPVGALPPESDIEAAELSEQPDRNVGGDGYRTYFSDVSEWVPAAEDIAVDI